MKRRTKRRSRSALRGWRALLAGVGLSLFALLVCALLGALVCYLSGDPLALSGIVGLVALLLGGGLSGFIFPRLCEDCAILPTVLSTLLTCLLLLLVGLILTRGELSAAVPLNYLCHLGVATLSAFLSRRLYYR